MVYQVIITFSYSNTKNPLKLTYSLSFCWASISSKESKCRIWDSGEESKERQLQRFRFRHKIQCNLKYFMTIFVTKYHHIRRDSLLLDSLYYCRVSLTHTFVVIRALIVILMIIEVGTFYCRVVNEITGLFIPHRKQRKI